MTKLISTYSMKVAELAPIYEAHPASEIHRSWSHLLSSGGMALDVGAGSGRDAAWLASLGYEVIAVEPAEGMRTFGKETHPSPRIQWLDDRLPGLAEIYKSQIRFDLILCSGVWMHVAPSERERAFRKMARLLKPGGCLILTLRHGPPPEDRPMEAVSSQELLHWSQGLALETLGLWASPDLQGRPSVSWETVAFRAPDDETKALPLLRHIILYDSKTTSYKLALLRSLLRIADGSIGAVLERRDKAESPEELVFLPLGMVALFWLRMYLPLLKPSEAFAGTRQALGAGLPTSVLRPFPQIGGTRELGFLKEELPALSSLSPFELSIGASFSGPPALAIHKTLQEIASTMKRGPVTYTTYPQAAKADTPPRPVFSCSLQKPRQPPSLEGSHPHLCLDLAYLSGFGRLTVPASLWDALSSYGSWIEPALVSEWKGLMVRFDQAQGFWRGSDAYEGALAWLDPEHKTLEIRKRIEALRAGGQELSCVWSQRRLLSEVAVDHCLPFAYWPNNDLWNLMPAAPKVNLQKSDRLPTAQMLEEARSRILSWWEVAYCESDLLRQRFWMEACASLSLLRASAKPDLEAIFAALQRQRYRLRVERQIPEWLVSSGFQALEGKPHKARSDA